jgi:hypothetical protein
MAKTAGSGRTAPPAVDPDALLCALILAPRTFPRNRYFSLFENGVAARVRRRAARIRGMIRQLASSGNESAEITGEQVLEDGRFLIRFKVRGLALQRTAALTALEAAALHYALHLAGKGKIESSERRLVERTLERLGADVVNGARATRSPGT